MTESEEARLSKVERSINTLTGAISRIDTKLNAAGITDVSAKKGPPPNDPVPNLPLDETPIEHTT